MLKRTEDSIYIYIAIGDEVIISARQKQKLLDAVDYIARSIEAIEDNITVDVLSTMIEQAARESGRTSWNTHNGPSTCWRESSAIFACEVIFDDWNSFAFSRIYDKISAFRLYGFPCLYTVLYSLYGSKKEVRLSSSGPGSVCSHSCRDNSQFFRRISEPDFFFGM